MTDYFVTTTPTPPMVLRTTPENHHEAFLRGAWTRTNIIMAYFAGEDNSVDPITETEARKLAPDAFA